MSETERIVFVVDDDRSVREGLVDLVTSVGLKAKAFASAQEFLRQKRPDAPACMVLDVRLPGSSGLDLQRQLSQSGEPIPIIFITGHGDIPMSVRAIKEGAVEFLSKPFRDQDLLDAIQQALKTDEAARKHRARATELRRRYRQDASRTGQKSTAPSASPNTASTVVSTNGIDANGPALAASSGRPRV
jgi:FixJ family two-component response regulator